MQNKNKKIKHVSFFFFIFILHLSLGISVLEVGFYFFRVETFIEKRVTIRFDVHGIHK